jgi:hypothetical protein
VQWGLTDCSISYDVIRRFFLTLVNSGVYDDDTASSPPRAALGTSSLLNDLVSPHTYVLSLRSARPESLRLYVTDFLQRFVDAVAAVTEAGPHVGSLPLPHPLLVVPHAATVASGAADGGDGGPGIGAASSGGSDGGVDDSQSWSRSGAMMALEAAGAAWRLPVPSRAGDGASVGGPSKRRGGDAAAAPSSAAAGAAVTVGPAHVKLLHVYVGHRANRLSDIVLDVLQNGVSPPLAVPAERTFRTLVVPPAVLVEWARSVPAGKNITVEPDRAAMTPDKDDDDVDDAGGDGDADGAEEKDGRASARGTS